MTESTNKVIFAPQIFIPSGIKDISFYLYAFGAVVDHLWQNDDGTIHVAELSINGTIFHLHEERPHKGQLAPEDAKGVTALVGLFVEDVDAVINNALKAGATLLNPARDYDYGYRQGEIRDPYGHQWLIEKKL
jgi:PhnB protein